MKVSVIIPCYNAEKYIEKCLTSILQDPLKEKEIIVINDGSKDQTLEMLQNYAKKHKEIVVIDQKNAGQGAARNRGLAKAKGTYIVFVDIDDYIGDSMLTKLYNYAKENKCDYVYCDYYEHYSNCDKEVKNTHLVPVKKDAILSNFAPWGKMISKKLIDEIDFSFPEGMIFEDISVMPWIAALSQKPGYLPEPLYFYNMSNLNTTTRNKKYDPRFEHIIKASDYLYELYLQYHLEDEFFEEFQYIFLDGILKSGILKFAKYKEGLKQIPVIRKNVKGKFSKLLSNRYFKAEPFYRKFTAILAVCAPSWLLYLMKQVKK